MSSNERTTASCETCCEFFSVEGEILLLRRRWTHWSHDGDAEKSAAEAVDAVPVALGRGQRKKAENTRYQGDLWELH